MKSFRNFVKIRKLWNSRSSCQSNGGRQGESAGRPSAAGHDWQCQCHKMLWQTIRKRMMGSEWGFQAVLTRSIWWHERFGGMKDLVTWKTWWHERFGDMSFGLSSATSTKCPEKTKNKQKQTSHFQKGKMRWMSLKPKPLPLAAICCPARLKAV